MAFLLPLIVSTALATAPAAGGPTRVDVASSFLTINGTRGGATASFTLPPSGATFYVYSGDTFCDATSASVARPASAGFGWEVTLTPVMDGRSPAVAASWRRLWEDGKTLTTRPQRATFQLQPGTPVQLDAFVRTSNASRTPSADWYTRLLTLSDAALIDVPEIALQPMLAEYFRDIAATKKQRETVQLTQHLGDHHPTVIAMNGQIESLTREAADRARVLIRFAQQHPESALLTAPTTSGCDALNMSLTVAAPAIADNRVIETELWFVHTDAAGRETTQRQVVRTNGQDTGFFFDPQVIKTNGADVRVDISGLLSRVMIDGEKVRMSLTVFQKRSSGPSGSSGFPVFVTPGEVVSMSFSDGPFGKFSIRLRARIL